MIVSASSDPLQCGLHPRILWSQRAVRILAATHLFRCALVSHHLQASHTPVAIVRQWPLISATLSPGGRAVAPRVSARSLIVPPFFLPPLSRPWLPALAVTAGILPCCSGITVSVVRSLAGWCRSRGSGYSLPLLHVAPSPDLQRIVVCPCRVWIYGWGGNTRSTPSRWRASLKSRPPAALRWRLLHSAICRRRRSGRNLLSLVSPPSFRCGREDNASFLPRLRSRYQFNS